MQMIPQRVGCKGGSTALVETISLLLRVKNCPCSNVRSSALQVRPEKDKPFRLIS